MAPNLRYLRCVGLALIATLLPLCPAAAQDGCPRLSDSSAATLLATDARLWSPRDRGNEPTDPIILRDLACTRWALWRTEVVARERPGMPLGSSWLEGAATMAWSGLRAPVVAPEVAAAAATLAAAEPLYLTSEQRFVAVREARSRAKEPAAALALDRACIVLGARLPTHAASVLECAQAGSAADPAGMEWRLAEAHALAHLADTAGAWTAWRAALERSRSAADWERITSEVRWFATPAEVTALEATPLAERAQAVVQLFDQRDLRSGAARGTYFTTFATRLMRARQEFGLRISRSQVQRFLTGPPTTDGSGLDPDRTFYTDWRELVRWQTEVDDRGIIFVRHGEPDVRVPPATRGRALEIWAYTRTAPPLFFQFEEEDFDGSVAATRVTVGRFNKHWCGIDVYRCLLDMRADFMKYEALLELFARLAEEDRQFITAAMSTDTPEERGAPLSPLLARAHRLWDPVSAEPILLVAYALPWPVPRTADPPLNVDLRLAWWGTTQRDTALTRQHVPPPRDLRRRQEKEARLRHAVGFVTLARDTATTSWRMQAVTGKTTRQAVGSGVRQGQREGITLSDLVIGNDESPLRWSVRGEPVAVDPGATLRSDLPISVFYQIRSEGSTRTITSRFRVARLGAREGERTDLIDVSLISELEPGLQQIAPTLDPRFLTPGDYGLELRVVSEEGVELAVATTSFRIAAPPKVKESR